MQNELKEYVDYYIPRKCFATNKIINAKDKASIQVTFSDVRKFNFVNIINFNYNFTIYILLIIRTYYKENPKNLDP